MFKKTNGELKTRPEASAESKLLYAAISKLAVNETILYADLSAIVRYDVRKKRGHLGTARRMAQKERIVTEAVPGVGLKRVDDNGLVDVLVFNRKKIHRAAKRTAAKAGCFSNLDALPQERKTQALSEVAFAGALSIATAPATVKRIESVTSKNGRLELDDTLKLFRN